MIFNQIFSNRHSRGYLATPAGMLLLGGTVLRRDVGAAIASFISAGEGSNCSSGCASPIGCRATR